MLTFAEETHPLMLDAFLRSYQSGVLKTIQDIDLDKLSQVIEMFKEARAQGRRIFLCGNGGSFATASHFVCEMVKSASYNRPLRFRIIMLGEGLPTLTAYSNDHSYECAFAENLKNFAEPGDIVMALSGSGNSPSVVQALEYGASIGCRTIALTGRDGGRLGRIAQLHINSAQQTMGKIEDSHMVIMHMICYYFMEEEPRLERQASSNS
jgi:D-sedoheptulose 7-phosphate isomerase